MTGDELPAEPMSPIVEATAQMHELYLRLQNGGFTAGEALVILGVMLANNRGNEREEG